jgi:hypothetical protein
LIFCDFEVSQREWVMGREKKWPIVFQLVGL